MLRTPRSPIKLQEKIGADLVKSADLTIAYMCAERAFDPTKEMPRKLANAWKIMNAMSVDSLAGFVDALPHQSSLAFRPRVLAKNVVDVSKTVPAPC